MANHDFYVSFGSNLPQFLSDTEAQVAALDASIKGIGGALKNLSGVDQADIAKLDKIASALSGGGAIHIDTRQLDNSIKGLQNSLATQLGKFTAALNKAPQPAAPQQGATLDVDLSPVRESFKEIKASVGGLKQQAAWTSGHVQGLRDNLSKVRGHLGDAKKYADKTIVRSRNISTAVDELNDKLKYATDIINRIKFEGPSSEGGAGTAAGSGGVLSVRIVGSDVPIEAKVATGTTATAPAAPRPEPTDPGAQAAKRNRQAAEEKSTEAMSEEVKAAKAKAKKIRENAGILEQLLQVRREELVLQRAKSRVETRSKGGDPKFASKGEEETYWKALDELTKVTERRKSLAKKVHDDEKARYEAANVPDADRTDDTKRLDALSEAYRAERDARMERANEILRSVAAEKTDAAKTEESVKQKQAAGEKKAKAEEGAAKSTEKAAKVAEATVSAQGEYSEALIRAVKMTKKLEEAMARKMAAGVIGEPTKENLAGLDKSQRAEVGRAQAVIGDQEFRQTLDSLAQSLSEAETKVYNALIGSGDAVGKMADFLAQQKPTNIATAAGPAGPASSVAMLQELNEGWGNALKQEADKPGKQLADGLLEAFQGYIQQRERTGAEQEAFDLREKVAGTGGRNLGTDLNVREGGQVGLVEKQVMAAAKSLAQILEEAHQQGGEKFVSELTTAFRQMPQLVGSFGTMQAGGRSYEDEDFTRKLVMPFPEGLPEELAAALARAVKEGAEQEGAGDLQEGIHRAIQGLMEALEGIRPDTQGQTIQQASPQELAKIAAQDQFNWMETLTEESRARVDEYKAALQDQTKAVDPIVLEEGGERIKDGFHRLRAALELGLDEVGVVLALPEVMARKARAIGELATRPGEATTASAIAVEGKAKIRDYGTFGGDEASRAAVDAAIQKIGEYGARMDELNSMLAITARELQPDLNPLEDLVPPEAPKMLMDHVRDLKARLEALPAGDAKRDDLQEEIRSTYATIKTRNAEIRAFESARRKLQEWMVALDDSLRATKGLGKQEEAYADVRYKSLKAEEQRLAALAEHQTAKADMRSAAREAMDRVSVEPGFRDMGRRVPSLDFDRDFPGAADTGDFRRAIEDYNQQRERFIIDLAKALDIPDPTDRAAAFADTDERFKGLLDSLDQVYRERNASVEEELNRKREELEVAKKSGGTDRAIADLESQITALETQQLKAKEEQARAQRERDFYTHVPRDPAGAVAVERQRLAQQTTRSDGAPLEGVYATPAHLAQTLMEAQEAAEQMKVLSDKYIELETNREANLRAIAEKRAQIEQELSKVQADMRVAAQKELDERLKAGEKIADPAAELEKILKGMVGRNIGYKDPTSDDPDRVLYRREGGNLMGQKQAALQEQLSGLPKTTEEVTRLNAAIDAHNAKLENEHDQKKRVLDAAGEYDAQLKSLAAEMQAQQKVLESFKAAFKDLFPAPDPRTGRGGRAGVEVVRGEQVQAPGPYRSDQELAKLMHTVQPPARQDLVREYVEVEAALKKFMKGLDETTRGMVERREALREDLGRKDADRQIMGPGNILPDRDVLEQEMRQLETSLGQTLEPLRDLDKRRDAVKQALAGDDAKIDRSGATVGPGDFTEAARIVGAAINEAIAKMVGEKFSALDRDTLLSASRVEPAGDAPATLARFERAMVDAIVAATDKAVGRMAETTGTRAVAAAGGGTQPPLPPTGGPAQSVRDDDGNAILRQISDGIQRLIACCEQMAAAGGLAAKTATAASKVAQPEPAPEPKPATATATQQALPGMEDLVKGANAVKEGAKSIETASKQHQQVAKTIITAGEMFRAEVEAAAERGFTDAEDMAKALVRGEGVAEPRSPKTAAKEAAEAFGVPLVGQEFEKLKVHAKLAAEELKRENIAKQNSTKETRTAAEAEAKWAERRRQASQLTGEARERLLPLTEALIELERQLKFSSLSAEDRAKKEEEARQTRAEMHALARGSSGRGGADSLLPEGGGHTRIAQTMIGYTEYKKAGDDAAHMFAEGFQTGIGKAGPKAFSFIDRMLQTTVNMFMRSIASRLTFGLQRQLRTLISTGMETEATFIRVSSAMQATGRSAQGLRGEITRISTSLGVSLNELYEITARLTGVFEDPQDVVRATESIALLEIISQGQLNAVEGYRALSAIQNTFWDDLASQGKEGEEAFAFINDATVAMQDLTGVNIEDLLSGAAQLGAVTAGLNLGFLETQAIVAKVAQTTGETGTAAAEKLGRIFANVTDPKFQEALLQMGVASQQQLLDKDFKAIFEQIADANLNETQVRALANLAGGDRQFRAATALFGESDQIVDAYERAMHSEGRAEERRADLMKELSNQLKILGTNFENFAATLVRSGLLNVFQTIVWLLNTALTPLNRFLTYLNDMADRSRFAGFIRMLVGVAVGMKAILAVARAMRHEIATAMKLGTAHGSKMVQAVNPRLGAQSTPPAQPTGQPPGALGRLGGYMGRKGGVEQVEVKNVKELGQAIRFRHAKEGMSGLEVARGVESGKLTHTRLRIGDPSAVSPWAAGLGAKGDVDIITKTFPRRSLDMVTGRMNALGDTMVRVGGAARITNAATASQITGEGLLARAKVTSGTVTLRLGNLMHWLSTGMNRAAIATANLGRRLMTASATFMKGKAGIVVAFAAIAAAMWDMRRRMFKEIQEIIDARFAPEPEDLDDEKADDRQRRQDLTGEIIGPRATLKVDELGNIVEGQFGNFRGFEGAMKRLGDGLKAMVTKNRFDNIRKETEEYFDGWREDLAALDEISDPQDRLDFIEELNEKYSAEEIREVLDKEKTGTGRALATEAAATLADLTDEALLDAMGALQGIDDARALTVSGVGRVRRMLGVVSSLPDGMASQFSAGIDMLLEAEQIPEAYANDLRRLAGSKSASQKRQIRTQILDDAVRAAANNLQAVLASTRSTQPEIDAAKQEYEAAMGEAAEEVGKQLNEQLEYFKSMSELAKYRGGTGVGDLRRAISFAREIARSMDAGSVERAQAELAVIELERQAVEAVNEAANQADALAAAVSRDPSTQLASQLATAKRNLQTAQNNKGLYTPEQLNQLVIEVTNLEQQVADNERLIAQAYSNLAKSRTRNPLTQALEDSRFALEELNTAQRLQMGEAEIANRQAAYNQAEQALQDQNWAIQDAFDAVIGGRITNVMAQHSHAVALAAAKLNRAVNNDMGSAAIYQAQREYEDALRAQADERRNITAAQEDFNVSRIQNELQRARAQAQVNARRMSQAATLYGRDSTQYIQAMQAYHESLDDIEAAQQGINAALRQLAIGRAQNAHLDVQAARLSYDDARQTYQEALRKYGAADSRTIQAQQQMEAAQAAVRDAILDDATRRIEWQLGMEHITQRQAIAAYQNILNTFELTQRQREDIMLKMKQMQDSINSSMEGQWNLGDIKIPTPYEVRRSIGMDGMLATVQGTADEFVSMLGAVATSVKDQAAALSSPGAYGAPTTQQSVTNETTVLVNGADVGEVRRILTQILGPQAVGTVTSGSSGTRRI